MSPPPPPSPPTLDYATARSSRRSYTPLLIVTLLIVSTVAVYARVGHFEFVSYDDDQFVTANPMVQQGLTPAAIRWSMTAVVASNWHPVTMLSFLLDVQLSGPRAGPAHVANLVLHVANSLLLYALLRSLTGSEWRSALVAALFALHPLHVESVAWVSERKDVLSTFFFLLTLIAYARYATQRRRGWYAAALSLYALGLMSKPMLVTTPGVMLLMDCWPLKRPARWRKLLVEKVPFVVLAVADAGVTFVLQRQTGAVSSLAKIPAELRVENAVVTCVRYLLDTVWPAKLAVFYPYPSAIPPLLVLAAAAVLAAITWLAWRQRHDRPVLLVGWLWYLLTLAPVIGLVQVGEQARADRYTYIPLIGVFIAVAWLAGEWAERSPTAVKVTATVWAALLAALALRTAAQVEVWRDSETLWSHAAAVTDDNWLAWNHLATVYAGAGRFEEATELEQRVIARRPTYAPGYLNLGNTRAAAGDLGAAIDAYTRAIQLQPNFASAHNNLGRALMMQNRIPEAVEQFAAAVAADPDNPNWQRNLQMARFYLARGTPATAPAGP